MENQGIVITIGGPPGSGTTTIAKAIASHFNLRYLSTGEIFRKVAEERGLSVLELDETAEKEVDLEVDRISKEEAAKGNIILESDLAAWMNPQADVKIWLDASLETRAKRVFNDEKKRTAESYNSLDEVKDKLKKRFEADKRRYKNVYGIDLDDLSIYDLVINTENLTIEEVINKIISYIEKR